MNRTRLVGVLAAAGLALAGCVTSAEDFDRETASQQPPQITPAASGAPAGLERFYTQSVDWQACESMWCTNVQVPMDYDNPDGKEITIAVKQLRSAEGDKPALLLNPGGPGGSGVQMMDYISQLSTEQLREAYHLTGFDPRGVNRSTAVKCEDDIAHDERRARDYDMSDPAEREQAAADVKAYGETCAANTGELLGFVDTVSAARDMDILRAVIAGSDTLDYLGFSYGTYLGATYADLFPSRVGHFVLDGALDPTLSNFELAAGQAEGFEHALRAYIADCQAGPSCPLRGDEDEAMRQLGAFFQALRSKPLPTDDAKRPLTRSLAMMGVITPLYNQASWRMLSMALDTALNEHDGTMLLYFADMMADRHPDGHYETNSDDAFVAINCLDYPVEGQMADWVAEEAQLREISPLFGADIGYGEMVCDTWPYQSKRQRTPLAAKGSGPIVVVGTTGDPATPYRWSQALADQLENARLVTYQGEGHTAYSAENHCISDIVDGYFIDDEVPAGGETCP